MWCHEKKNSLAFINSCEIFCTHPPDLEIPLTSLRFWWARQYFSKAIRWNLSRTLHISTPASFPTSSFSSPHLCPLSFIPRCHGSAWLGFHSLKTKHQSREGDDEGGLRANWQAGVKVSLSPPLSYSLSPLFLSPFYCPVHLLWMDGWTTELTENC